MRLLASVVTGVLGSNLELTQVARQSLIEACLELVCFTAQSREILPNADEWLDSVAGSHTRHPMILQRVQMSDAYPAIQRMANSEDAPQWMTALGHAFRGLHNAITELRGTRQSTTAKAIRIIQDRIWRLTAYRVWAGQSKETSGNIMAMIADELLPTIYEEYLELGVMHPLILAQAIARKFTSPPDVPNGPQGIEPILSEAFRVWDLADASLGVARKSTTLTGILVAAHECHLSYTLAEILIAWAIGRQPPESRPAELSRERQIVEELKATMKDTLRDLGYHFAAEPSVIAGLKYIAAARAAIAPSKRFSIQLRETMRQASSDAALRNPLFPDVLVPVMAECCAGVPAVISVQRPVHGGAGALLKRLETQIDPQIDKFTSRIVARYSKAFSDVEVLNYARNISSRWDVSRENTQQLEEFDRLLRLNADSQRNHLSGQLRQLLTDLERNPFIVIRRECQHPLRLGSNAEEVVRIARELQGSRCPTCGSRVHKIDVVLAR